MTTIALSRSAGHLDATPSGALALARRFYAGIVRRSRLRHDRRVLRGMPDLMLRDIGLSRGEIDSVTEFGRARGPQW
jgi:uncharacterized protein YjiS (DUF1127 family)